MAQSSRILAYRRFCDLNWSDHPLRMQALPLIMRRMLNYLFSTTSLSQMLRAEGPRFSVHTLNMGVNEVNLNITRDVAVYSGFQLRWHARSFIQAHSLTGMNWSQTGSLGDFLFAAKGMRRTKLTLTRVEKLPFLGITSRSWYWQRESCWQMEMPKLEFVILEFF